MHQSSAARVAMASKPMPLLAAVLFLNGCAYVGSPLPPLVNMPARVTDLHAVQRGGRIIVHFTLPLLTTEGMTIKPPLKLDLRIGAANTPPDSFKPLPEGAVEKGAATYEIPTADWTGKDAAIAVRTIAENGKSSEWSEPVTVSVVPAPPPPAAAKVDSTADGVRLTWQGPPGDFRIFRRSPDDKDFARLADVTQEDWVDHTSEYGKPYIYLVQRIVKSPNNQEAESDASPELPITPTDTFPPAVPSGLRAGPAPESVELSWERSTDADLAGYRIYRATGGGDFARLAEVSQIPSYSDHAVEHGKQYRYAVTSFDQSGNESERSSVVEASVQ